MGYSCLSAQENQLSMVVPTKEIVSIAEETTSVPLKPKESPEHPLKTMHNDGDGQISTMKIPKKILSSVNLITLAHAANQASTTSFNNKYIVQAGRFANVENALFLRSRLKSKGYPAQIMQEQLSDSEAPYTVIIGIFASKAKANDLTNSYKSVEKLDAFTTKLSDQTSRIIIASN